MEKKLKDTNGSFIGNCTVAICLLAPQNQDRLSGSFVRNSFCTVTAPDLSGQLYVAVKKHGPLFRSKLQSLLHYFLGIRRRLGFNYYPQTDGHTEWQNVISPCQL